MNSTTPRRLGERRTARRFASGVTSVAVAAAGLVGFGLAAATPAQAATTTVDDAELRWGISEESTGGAFLPGSWNLFSAGKLANPGEGSQRLNAADEGATWLNGSPAGWTNTDGNVTVLDKQADGSHAPTTWAGTRTDAEGTPVNTGSVVSENLVSVANGTGEVDTATDTGTITWDGDFTAAFYSGMTFYYVSDPVLEVTDGVGTLSATLSGYGSSQADPTVWEALEPTEVTLADLQGVDLTDDGFTVTPEYLGVEYDAPDTVAPQVRTGEHWGSFPASFVNFQVLAGSSSYWYSSGGSVDSRKPASPIDVTWGPPPAQVSVSETEVSPTGQVEITVEGTGFDPALATGTRPPLLGKPAGSYVVFGKFAEDWRPSEGATGSTRVNADQKWAVLAEDMATIGGEARGAIELTPEGTFSTTLVVDKAALDAKVAEADDPAALTNYGVYTYAGGGAIAPTYETYTPVAFTSTVSASGPAKAKFRKNFTIAVDVATDAPAAGKVKAKLGSKTLRTGTLVEGTATLRVSRNLPVGKHRISVNYLGDTTSAPSSTTVRLRVTKASSRTIVTVLRKPARTKPGRLKVRVKTQPAGPGVGKVTIKIRNNKGKLVRTVKAKLNKRGIVKRKVGKLAKGRYKLVTTYTGNRNIKRSKKVRHIRVTR